MKDVPERVAQARLREVGPVLAILFATDAQVLEQIL